MIWRTYVPVVLQRFIIHLGLLITIVKHLQIFQLFSKYSIWWYGGEGDLHVHVFFKVNMHCLSDEPKLCMYKPVHVCSLLMIRNSIREKRQL